jgi:hypothetical protein
MILMVYEKASSGSKFPLAIKIERTFSRDIAAAAGAGKREKWWKVRRSKHLWSLSYPRKDLRTGYRLAEGTPRGRVIALAFTLV